LTLVERHHTASAGATEELGEDLARRLQVGDLVLLEGELAAGKTTFVRGILRGLGGNPDVVSSPTFVLLQTYDCSAWGITCLHHVDLYRLDDKLADLREVGLEEVLSDPGAVVVVEWPKSILATWLPSDARTWRATITTVEDGSRRIEINPPENQF